MFPPVLADISAGPSLSSHVRLAPGAKALGRVAFEAPKDATGAQMQRALDSGRADETGRWKRK
ncbi:hypothetical protein [Streptomyces sp. NPDC058374]|uniref:hypothetical protein n=1 Tax=unclassified Streptomyces TaxID=2593676 RepID=UPI0036556E31